MPDDKDFKRLVRTHVTEHEVPYTAARAALRPDEGDRAGVAEASRTASHLRRTPTSVGTPKWA